MEDRTKRFQEKLINVHCVIQRESVRVTPIPSGGCKNNHHILSAALQPYPEGPFDFPGHFDITESETSKQSVLHTWPTFYTTVRITFPKHHSVHTVPLLQNPSVALNNAVNSIQSQLHRITFKFIKC